MVLVFINWVAGEWHKVVIGFVGICHLRQIIKEFLEYAGDARKFIIERRHTPMINLGVLADLPKDLALLATVVPKIQAAIPLIQKNADAIRQAIADQKNPAAEMADVSALLDLLTTDLAALGSLLPPAKPN